MHYEWIEPQAVKHPLPEKTFYFSPCPYVYINTKIIFVSIRKKVNPMQQSITQFITFLLYGNAQLQTAAKIHAYGGRGPQTSPKTKQENVTEIDTKLIPKSDTKHHGTLKRSGKYNASIF